MADKSTITPDRARIIVKGSSNSLYVNEVDGKPWICDRYWATPATPVLTALLSKHGHGLEPATYFVDAKITAKESDPPNIARIIPEGFADVETSDAWQMADFAHLPGVRGRICDQNGAVLLEAGGKVFGVNPDYLSILTGRVDPFATYDTDSKRSVELAIYAQTAGQDHKPLVVISRHALKVNYGAKSSSDEMIEDVRAILMPVRFA